MSWKERGTCCHKACAVDSPIAASGPVSRFPRTQMCSLACFSFPLRILEFTNMSAVPSFKLNTGAEIPAVGLGTVRSQAELSTWSMPPR